MSKGVVVNTYVVLSSAGPHRDLARATREQAYWDEHARFVDALVDDGFVLLGGPLPDEHGALLVVNAASEAEVIARLEPDPWYRHGLLTLDGIRRWEIFVDARRT